MKRLKTLRARFAAWTAGLLLATLGGFGLFEYASLSSSLYRAEDDLLQLSVTQVMGVVNYENGQIATSDNISDSPATIGSRERGISIRVLNQNGQVVQSTGTYAFAQPVVQNPLPHIAYFETIPDPATGAPTRVYYSPVLQNGNLTGAIQVAHSMAGIQETLAQLLVMFLLGAPLAGLAAAAGGYFLAARALSPIDRITRMARDLSASDLSARLALPATDDEVGRLARTFDGMLARLDESFGRERRFVADASHELRTPLAGMQAILSVMREERRTPEDYEHALADLSDETNRMRTLVDDLLQLARGDAPDTKLAEKVQLSTLLESLCDSLGATADQRRLALACDCAPGLTVMGDTDSLLRLFINILDNALKYTRRGRITVQAGRAEGFVRVRVSDTGPGIAPEHLAHIFDRFYRVDPSRSTAGSGLGLAIALQIARVHGGDIRVESALGSGSTFTVELPLSPDENPPGAAAGR